MNQVVITASATALVGAIFCFSPLSLLANPSGRPVVDLRDPRFNASGEGDKTLGGSIADGDNLLVISDPAGPIVSSEVVIHGPEGVTTWRVGQGVRVRRAGDDQPVHTADSGWRQVGGDTEAPPCADAPGAAVCHDEDDPSPDLPEPDGDRSVRCTFLTTPPVPGATVDLCEVDLGARTDFRFDEIRFWVKSSMDTSAGDLQLILADESGPISGAELEVPALTAAKGWTEQFVPMQTRSGNHGAVRKVTLRCNEPEVTTPGAPSCAGRVVHLDDVSLAQDLLATVRDLRALSGGGVALVLGRDDSNQPILAGRAVVNEIVYHDDKEAVRSWLREAQAGGAELYAPAGVYYLSHISSLPLYSNTRLRCQSADTTVFKHSGRLLNGPLIMFQAGESVPQNITVENCGFDLNGWNGQRLLVVLHIAAVGSERVRNVVIRNNRFFDSIFDADPAARMKHCDRGLHQCATFDRSYVLIRTVDGARVENNRLSGGGGIHVGGGVRNVSIRNNLIDFVNEQGISIVDIDRTHPGEDACRPLSPPSRFEQSGSEGDGPVAVSGQESQPGGRENLSAAQPPSNITERVKIIGNTILNQVGHGIFFGADGGCNDSLGMALRDVEIRGNYIRGFFYASGITGVFPATTDRVRVTYNTVVAVRESKKPLALPLYTAGISLSRGDCPIDPATNIQVTGNTLVAAGPYGEFNVGGLRIEAGVNADEIDVLCKPRVGSDGPGPLSNLWVLNNTVRCERGSTSGTACHPGATPGVDHGIFLTTGEFANVILRGNRVAGATTALGLGQSVGPVLTVTGAVVERNVFSNSTHPDLGQITVALQGGGRIEARVVNNAVRGGAGYGILCKGMGMFLLTDLITNDFSGNVKGDHFGCP